MADAPAVIGATPLAPGWQQRLRGFAVAARPRTFLEAYGMVVVALIVVLVIAAPLIAPYGPLEQNVGPAIQAPSGSHVLGTDQLGRDVFSRMLYGGRNSLLIAVMVIALAGSVGVVVGAISGFAGGIVDEVLMRIVDIFLAFPAIMLALVVSAALGPSLENAAISIAVAWWPVYARLIRGQVIVVKEREFVRASRTLGASPLRLLGRVVLPNSIGVMKTVFILDVGYAIIAGSTLGFLGLGVSLPTPEWGSMIRESIERPDAWWLTLSPGIAIVLFVSALNFAGGVVTRSTRESP
jgi:peptide/nickel transport system permease protein